MLYFICFTLLLTVTAQRYTYKAKFQLPHFNTYLDTFRGMSVPNRKPLIETTLYSTLYDSNPMDQFSVHSANVWNKIWGLKCPPGHVVHPIIHHVFSELYVCVKVPHTLQKKYDVYKLYHGEHNFYFFCGVTGQQSDFGRVDVDRLDDYRLLVDVDGYHYLSSAFCLSHYYQLDTNGKDIFSLNYTSTDDTITFTVPPKSCAIAPIYNNVFDIVNMPFSVTVSTTNDVIACLRADLGRSCPGDKPFVEMPLDDKTLLTYNVTSKNDRGCSSIYTNSFVYETVTYHISAAISNSPIHVITTTLASVILPIFDLLVNSLTYIVESLIDVLESPEFGALFERLLQFLLKIFVLVYNFISDVIVPKIYDIFSALPLKYKILLLLLLIFYLKTTKFLFSLCIVAILWFCVKEK
uniref:Uncharacterized protein n=1 Tax=Feitosa virus TaxID=2976199 RepID=A0A9E8ILH7_9VIRU|nr:hypothetical protein 2 [Feitosa virus]